MIFSCRERLGKGKIVRVVIKASRSSHSLTFFSYCIGLLASEVDLHIQYLFGGHTCSAASRSSSRMRFLQSLTSLPLLGTSVLAHAISPRSTVHQHVGRSTPYEVKEPPLSTSWTDKAGTNPWPEYPRPQLQRDEWQNLNGIWQYQNASSLDAVKNPPTGQNLAHEVLVPSCLEGSLSGTC